MTHPAETVNRIGEVILDSCVTRGYTMGTLASSGIAEDVLDALVAGVPEVAHTDGRVRIDWPNGVDPDRDPALGAQFVLVDARLLARLVSNLNEAEQTMVELHPVHSPPCCVKRPLSALREGK